MIQKVNGVKLMVMVRTCPDYKEVERAVQEGRPVVLETASYSGCVESVGKFELVDVRRLRRTPDGFRFRGSIVGMDVDVHPDDEHRSIVYAKSGNAVVVVDENGADLEFVINLSLHIM